ncbi:hypothetical protein [Roseibium suaedae]|uniref:Uncharacterized protein n=1 Tax=Roseibium suaedae TaxID=735517 RepID=A0A1M7MNC0_9HYPH|nr:hypothetical protein [Roseibium suaedae]SHM91978.1 hypothetical protein SAMN05444272_3466 [Roseibium suaedae]
MSSMIENIDFNSQDLKQLIYFLRNDLSNREFEKCLYNSIEINDIIGNELYLKAISTNFKQKNEVENLKDIIREFFLKILCSCQLEPSRKVSLMGRKPAYLEQVERCVNGKFWLHRFRCNSCGDKWLMAAEEIIYDTWIIERESELIPDIFLTYQDLMEFNKSTGIQIRYENPYISMEIPSAIQILKEEDKSISNERLSNIIGVDIDVINHYTDNNIDIFK